MSLKLDEILKLSILSSFCLVAGKHGLQRIVTGMGILDHEYADIQNPPMEADDIFAPGSFVLTSLLFAKDTPDKILPAFKQLLIDGCCAVAVKKAFYQELPQDVLDFANEESFPIFLYENTDMENIIYEVYAVINQQKDLYALEGILTEIIEGGVTLEQKESRIKALFGRLLVPYHCEYSLFLKPMDNLSYERMFMELNSRQQTGYLFLPYRRGVLTVISELLAQNNSWKRKMANHVTGISNPCTKWSDFSYAAIESISAAKYAKMNHLSRKAYCELGIYKLLLPEQNNYWLPLLCREMTDKIQGADPNGELWETVVEYVKQGMDINRTAQVLILHKNTVRYRVGKVAKLMGYEEEKPEFYTVLYLIVKKIMCNC